MDEIYTHQDYPKWVYRTDGPQESYEEGTEPVLVQSEEEEAALKPKRGRKPKAEGAE